VSYFNLTWVSHMSVISLSHISESLVWVWETMPSHVTYEWVMSHLNESCHIWMSHVTYEWVMSHMNESCRIWMSRISYKWVTSHAYEWVTSRVNESWRICVCRSAQMQRRSKMGLWHTWTSHVICIWVTSHMCGQVCWNTATLQNGSWHT